jgi:hypothetical protein
LPLLSARPPEKKIGFPVSALCGNLAELPSRRYDRLKLVANNSRFLILPQWQRPNLESHTLAQCEKSKYNSPVPFFFTLH